MRGESFLIAQKMVKEGNYPISEKIGNNSAERIIHVIMEEYINDLKREMQLSPYNTIILESLGSFTTELSRLKGYIRKLIKAIRKLRKRLVVLEKKEDFKKENSMTWRIERDLTAKLGFAWKQLDERRELMIMKYLRYYHRCRIRNEHHKIKYNYEWYPYKFLKEYGYNNEIFKKDNIFCKKCIIL